MIRKTATENAVNPTIEYSEVWNKNNELYRTFKIWMTEGWSKSFLQQFVGGGWKTLY